MVPHRKYESLDASEYSSTRRAFPVELVGSTRNRNCGEIRAARSAYRIESSKDSPRFTAEVKRPRWKSRPALSIGRRKALGRNSSRILRAAASGVTPGPGAAIRNFARARGSLEA